MRVCASAGDGVARPGDCAAAAQAAAPAPTPANGPGNGKTSKREKRRQKLLEAFDKGESSKRYVTWVKVESFCWESEANFSDVILRNVIVLLVVSCEMLCD